MLPRPKHGETVLHDAGHSAYLLELEMLAAQANALRPPRLPKPRRWPRLQKEPERVSLLTWLLWDGVLLAYGVAALVLLKVVR